MKKRIMAGVFAAAIGFLNSSAAMEVPEKKNIETDCGDLFTVTDTTGELNLSEKSKKDALCKLGQMYDDQIDVFLGKDKQDNDIVICVTTYKPDQFLNFEFPFLGFPYTVFMSGPGGFMPAFLPGSMITKEIIQKIHSEKYCDVEKISIFSESSVPCPGSFKDFSEMIDFLKTGYLGEQVTPRIMTAYKKTIKAVKTEPSTDPKLDHELNIAFCKEFFKGNLFPAMDTFAPWLDHSIKHFMVMEEGDSLKSLSIEKGITLRSCFYISHSKSYAESNKAGGKISSTIFLGDWDDVMQKILDNRPIVMGYEKGSFIFRAEDPITKRPLDYVELPFESMPKNWGGVVELFGNRGDRLSDFFSSFIISKDQWPQNEKIKFFFRLTIGPGGKMRGSMYPIIPESCRVLLRDNTAELKSRVASWLVRQNVSSSNKQLIDQLTMRLHPLLTLGVTEETLKQATGSLDEEMAVNVLELFYLSNPSASPEELENGKRAFAEELKFLKKSFAEEKKKGQNPWTQLEQSPTMKAHPEVRKFATRLIDETVSIMRLSSVLKILPIPEFVEAIDKYKGVTLMMERARSWAHSLKYIDDCLKKGETLTRYPEVDENSVKMALLTKPELIGQLKKAGHSIGGKKCPMVKPGSFFDRIIKDLLS